MRQLFNKGRPKATHSRDKSIWLLNKSSLKPIVSIVRLVVIKIILVKPMPALRVLRKLLCLAEPNVFISSLVLFASSTTCTINSELFLRVSNFSLVVNVAITPHSLLILFFKTVTEVCCLSQQGYLLIWVLVRIHVCRDRYRCCCLAYKHTWLDQFRGFFSFGNIYLSDILANTARSSKSFEFILLFIFFGFLVIVSGVDGGDLLLDPR